MDGRKGKKRFNKKGQREDGEYVESRPLKMALYQRRGLRNVVHENLNKTSTFTMSWDP